MKVLAIGAAVAIVVGASAGTWLRGEPTASEGSKAPQIVVERIQISSPVADETTVKPINSTRGHGLLPTEDIGSMAK